MITTTFDPDDVFTAADLAHAIGVSRTAAKKWLKKNQAALPEPLFTLMLSRTGWLAVWDGGDGRSLVDQYRTERAERGL